MFRFKVDDKTFKQLESALKDLPEEMRRKPVEQAFVKAAQELKKGAVSIGKQYSQTGSWAKAQQVVRGLLQQGSKAGLRIGGLGKTAGVRRRRRYKFGKQDGRRLTGKGGFIVKNAKTGYLHRIAGIRHPGFGGHDIYGRAVESKSAAATAKFEQLFGPILERYKNKHGFA